MWRCHLFDYSTYILFCVHWHGGLCLRQLGSRYFSKMYFSSLTFFFFFFLFDNLASVLIMMDKILIFYFFKFRFFILILILILSIFKFTQFGWTQNHRTVPTKKSRVFTQMCNSFFSKLIFCVEFSHLFSFHSIW